MPIQGITFCEVLYSMQRCHAACKLLAVTAKIAHCLTLATKTTNVPCFSSITLPSLCRYYAILQGVITEVHLTKETVTELADLGKISAIMPPLSIVCGHITTGIFLKILDFRIHVRLPEFSKMLVLT